MTFSKKPDFSFESFAINRLPEIRNRQLRWRSPAARRADFMRYRAYRLTLRVDQRYTPLVPSRLRMMTTAAELPDPEPSSGSCPELSDDSDQSDATIDNPPSDDTVDTALSDMDVDSSTSDWETESGSSSDETDGSE